MGGELAAHQAQIATLQTQLAGHTQRLDALVASDEQQQAQLDRCKPVSSAATPAPGAESVAAELGALRAGQEAAAVGHAAQQAQIDALRAGEEARRRLQAAAPASQGDFVRIYRFTVDAGGVSQTAAASRGGKRRALAEEVSCTKDYVHEQTFAINTECCDEPSEDCAGGTINTCNTGCAALLLPLWASCKKKLGAAATVMQVRKPPSWTRSWANLSLL